MDTPKRRTLQTLAGLGALAALPSAWAQVRAVELRNTPVSREYDLSVAETPLNITGKPAQGITINGTMPGPVLRFREGDEVVIRVTNNLREVTGIHWHGLLVPNDQDGVPGVTYPGIRPGEHCEVARFHHPVILCVQQFHIFTVKHKTDFLGFTRLQMKTFETHQILFVSSQRTDNIP